MRDVVHTLFFADAQSRCKIVSPQSRPRENLPMRVTLPAPLLPSAARPVPTYRSQPLLFLSRYIRSPQEILLLISTGQAAFRAAIAAGYIESNKVVAAELYIEQSKAIFM